MCRKIIKIIRVSVALGCVFLITEDYFAGLAEAGRKSAFEELREFQEDQLRFSYQSDFRFHDLYKSAVYNQEADIAATGFGLAGLCVSVERGLIDFETAKAMALATITQCINLESSSEKSKFGFLYHYYVESEGELVPTEGAEVSTADTAYLIAGMLTAAEYFGDEVKTEAHRFYKKVKWNKFWAKKEGLFRVAWKDGQFVPGMYWGFYTDELLLINLLAAGAPKEKYRVYPEETMPMLGEHVSEYIPGEPYAYTLFGSLFTYYVAHIFFDFRELGPDKYTGIDWWQNSVYAARAHIQYGKDKGYPENVWGISDCWSKEHSGEPFSDTNKEYRFQIGAGRCWHTSSREYNNKKNGVWPIASHGAICTLPFFEGSLEENPAYLAFSFMRPNMVREDGFICQSVDANDLDGEGRPQVNSSWDVGMDILKPPLMIENAVDGTVWRYFMENKFVKKAIERTFGQ